MITIKLGGRPNFLVMSYFFCAFDGFSEEGDHIEDLFGVLDVVDEIGIWFATIDVKTLESGVILFDSLLEPIDEAEGDFDVSFFVCPILISLITFSSLRRGGTLERVDEILFLLMNIVLWHTILVAAKSLCNVSNSVYALFSRSANNLRTTSISLDWAYTLTMTSANRAKYFIYINNNWQKRFIHIKLP